MTDRATLQARLDRYEAALDQLLLGETVQTVSADGETVTFTAANEAALRVRIAELKMRLGSGHAAPFGVVL